MKPMKSVQKWLINGRTIAQVASSKQCCCLFWVSFWFVFNEEFDIWELFEEELLTALVFNFVSFGRPKVDTIKIVNKLKRK